MRHGIWRLVYTGEKYLSVTVLYIHFFLDFCPMDTRLKSGSSIASIESRSSFLSFFLFFFQLSASLWTICSPDVKWPIDDLTDGG